jgi:hypothetical protein
MPILVNVRVFDNPKYKIEAPPSVAVLGDNVYCLARSPGTHLSVATFDLQLSGFRWVTTGEDGYKAPSIARSDTDSTLYVGFGGENTQLNLSALTFDSNGYPHLTPPATSAQGCDSFPTLFTAPDGLMMAWQSKPGSFLWIAGFIPGQFIPGIPGQTSDFLRYTHAINNQYQANTPPTMAVIDDKLYVAYSTYRDGGDYLNVVVFDREHGLDSPIKYFPDLSYNRCRGGSIAAFGGQLYVGFPDDQKRISIGQLKLDDHKIPYEFVVLENSNSEGAKTDTFPLLFATRLGMHMAWASNIYTYFSICDVQV